MDSLDLEALIMNKAALADKSGDELVAALFELASLDERGLQILKNTTDLDPQSLEYEHNRARLRALVSSGTVSALLADIATTVVDTSLPESYYNSRDNFLAEIDDNSRDGVSPYDLGGKLSRLVEIGAPKERIVKFLNENTYFQSQRDLLESPSDSEAIEGQLARYRIKSLIEVLEKIEDPKIPVDFAAVAKERVSKYDSEGAIASLIDSGSSSKEILEALKGNSEWESDAYDYLTQEDVDVPQDYQKASWGEFAEILFSIKDLDLV